MDSIGYNSMLGLGIIAFYIPSQRYMLPQPVALPEIGSFQKGGPARAISQKGAFGVLNGPRLGQTLTWLLEMGKINRDLKAQK